MTQGGTRGSDINSSKLLIVEVYYASLVDNEFVKLENIGSDVIDITDWTITDGEGSIGFPRGTTINPGSKVTITQNSTLYFRDTLEFANFSIVGGNATRMIRLGGTFRLNNQADEVVLMKQGGAIMDTYVYGGSVYQGPGWNGKPALILSKGLVAHRQRIADRYLDLNASSDWDSIRNYKIGQSVQLFKSFEFDGSVQGVISPDNSFEALTGLIESATSTVYLNVYEFSDTSIANLLRSALERQVEVFMFVEGQPVGGFESFAFELLKNLSQSGAMIRLMMGDEGQGVSARYRYNHAKYLIVDNRTVFVSSENFGTTGFPSNSQSGNRGWSVIIHDIDLARYLSDVFLVDFEPRRLDSIDFDKANIQPVQTVEDINMPFKPIASRGQFTGHFKVTPVLGPEHTLEPNAILNLMKSARSSLHIEQFFIRKSWGSGVPNLYLEEAIEAARRGVEVRILLDSSWYNIDDEDPLDNDNTVTYIQEIATTEKVPLQAKLGDAAAHNLIKFHNKGLIVDGEKVLISSINWNLNSVVNNRELGLIIENIQLAEYFEEAFEYDWRDDVTPPIADAGLDIVVSLGDPVLLSGLASVDDTKISKYLWDIGGDGVFDIQGSVVTWQFNEPGEYKVVLVVEDEWGNRDQDKIVVTVRNDVHQPDLDAEHDLFPHVLILTIIMVSITSIVLISRRKR